MWVLFQSASCGKNTTAGRWSAMMAAITSTDVRHAAESPVRALDVDVLESARRGRDQVKPEIVAGCSQLARAAPAWRALLLPCVTATFTTRIPASRMRRSASPPMMHSSSGCGEKMSARGASACDRSFGATGKPPSWNLRPSFDEPRELGDVPVIRVHGLLAMRRQAGGGNGLAVALVVLIGHVKRNAHGRDPETRPPTPRVRLSRCRFRQDRR